MRLAVCLVFLSVLSSCAHGTPGDVCLYSSKRQAMECPNEVLTGDQPDGFVCMPVDVFVERIDCR